MSDSQHPTPSSPEEQAANARRLDAEAAKLLAEARQAEARARMVEHEAEVTLVKTKELEDIRLADDDHSRVYRLLGAVGSQSAQAAITTLTRWHRLDPQCDITFILDSPGGSIIDGFALYDTITWLRSRNHTVTTIANGMAASMAGVLLQAGDVRVMGPQASLLIHEASFMTMGSMGQIEDEVEFVKKLQDRILGIYAERSNLSKAQIKTRFKRKNWWMDAAEALKHGFVDLVQ